MKTATDPRIGNVKDWHNPFNDDCPHNREVELDCGCKRPVKRKPFRVCKTHDTLTKDRGHKTSPDIIIEVHPNGRLVFREKGKRTRFETTSVKVYEGLRWRAAMVAAQQSKAKRKNRSGRKRH